jgi:hypothetical protein
MKPPHTSEENAKAWHLAPDATPRQMLPEWRFCSYGGAPPCDAVPSLPRFHLLNSFRAASLSKSFSLLTTPERLLP